MIRFALSPFTPFIRTTILPIPKPVRGMATLSIAQLAELVKVDVLPKNPGRVNEEKLLEISRTFISDTVTVPTKEMLAYASEATRGDDVYHEPTAAAFEQHIAKITGKEAALFMPSGTASNQIALRTHLQQPPYSVLCDYRAHINKYEAGGAAFHSGAAVTAVIPSNRHHLTLADVKEHAITGTDIHFAPTQIIALENTLNGTVIPQEEVVAICDYAHSIGAKAHLDGARIWHVAVESGKSIEELCKPFDSISLCFSKGLGAPVGSCLVGTKAFIQKARWFRKLFGGGMRQIGVLTAAAAYALTHNFPKLATVHQLTRRLENGLEDIGVKITSRAETCMVFYDPAPIGVTYEEIADKAAALPQPLHLGGSRLVVHIQTSEEAVNDFLGVVKGLADEKKAAGFVAPREGVSESYGDIYVRRPPKAN
ncbi:hypothetical protein AX16_005499 [Volvariella volvacea WC 439]|nr:hypothetical protein AX16_005499 [Volvariella volvacea WC 439]